MTVSASIWPANACKKAIRFRWTKMLNRWYTHSMSSKHLQSETLPQKTQSLIFCWKPSSAPNFLWLDMRWMRSTGQTEILLGANLHCLGPIWSPEDGWSTLNQCVPPGGGGTPLYKLYMYVKPHRVGFLGRFGLESGVVFGGTTGVYERIYRFNSKWVRKKEKYANSKWIWWICFFAL